MNSPAENQPPVPSDGLPPADLPPSPPRRRRWKLPLALFVITCLSTFWGGAAGIQFAPLVFSPRVVWAVLQVQWLDGLKYMAAVMAILLAHEMGHFVLTLRHRIPASWPLFIPMPLTFIGTMGAVIAMQAFRANRKQLFDIGIAGPLAGLVIALPVTVLGIQQASVVEQLPAQVQSDEEDTKIGPVVLHDPLIVKLLIRWLRPDAPHGELYLNPLLTAGWVGLLITGLNMMPISQLDGGHISYALLGRRAHTLARLFVLAAVIFMLWAKVYQWAVMLLLVMLIGVDHPPTSNDHVSLGRGRKILGWTSFLIPILCFPPMGISVL